LPLERKENNALGGLEGLLLGLVTEAREIISLLSGEGDLAWSKLKQLEVESYQVLNLVSGTSGDIRQTLENAFQDLNRQIGESSPALLSVIQGFDSAQRFWNGTGEAPRST